MAWGGTVGYGIVRIGTVSRPVCKSMTITDVTDVETWIVLGERKMYMRLRNEIFRCDVLLQTCSAFEVIKHQTVYKRQGMES